MIYAKDLMIGNWVRAKINNSPCVVTSLHLDDNVVEFICPIPVAIELLERIGFKGYDLDNPNWKSWECFTDDYRLSVYDISNSGNQRPWHVHIDNDVACTIGSGDFKFVHELQNLVRLITGKDLPITKEMLL